MKILKNFAIFGFSPNQALQAHPFNGRITAGFLICGLVLTCELVYFFQESHSFMEYSQLIYLISAAIVVTTALVVLLCQMDAMFKLIIRTKYLCNGKKNLQIKSSLKVSFRNLLLIIFFSFLDTCVIYAILEMGDSKSYEKTWWRNVAK